MEEKEAEANDQKSLQFYHQNHENEVDHYEGEQDKSKDQPEDEGDQDGQNDFDSQFRKEFPLNEDDLVSKDDYYPDNDIVYGNSYVPK